MSKRKIAVDTHTHTILSGHAFSTLRENCAYAASIGLAGLCLTDHGPAMEGAVSYLLPENLGLLPERVEGILVIPGLEFNIVDYDGHLDGISEKARRVVRFGIASFHNVVLRPGTRAENTEAMIGALRDPVIRILGHPDRRSCPIYREEVVLAAKNAGKLIEINNKSIASCRENFGEAVEIAKLCRKHDVRVCVSSDAHFDEDVGTFGTAFRVLDEAEFPNELILNADAEAFFAWIGYKGPGDL